MYRTSYCIVLMNNEMHNSYNQFLLDSSLSALHVSNESSNSSSGARHNILYYTVQSEQLCYQASLAASKQLDSPDSTIVLCNTVYYAVLLMMND